MRHGWIFIIMKKLLYLLLFCPLVAFGQLDYQIYVPNYEVIYHQPNVGELRYTPNGWILYGITDGVNERNMASIYLGSTSSSAIQSIHDLQEIPWFRVPTGILVPSGYESSSYINKCDKQLVLVTEDVKGVSYSLNYFKWDKLIQAIYQWQSKQ